MSSKHNYKIFPGHVTPHNKPRPGRSWGTTALSPTEAAEWYFAKAGGINKDEQHCTVVGPQGLDRDSARDLNPGYFPTIAFFTKRPVEQYTIEQV